MCVAFHPRFLENRKYYVNYHVRNQGSFFSPVIVERQATPDLRRDAGVPSRRLLQIHQDTDLHWGGMLAFGPDGFLYIGAGDAGPQEDPEGHGQDLSLLTGSILRIDVDRQQGGKPYAIPESNPYRNAAPPVRPEIWASGFRMPWRFSFDPVTGDLWVGDVGQDLFEKVSIVRAGENHGWNVYEGFMKFSDQYRREGETYTPPVMTYRRKYGPSVTGGYVYRGKRNASYYGAYIFGDFESKRIWALTQADRQLIKVRQIGESPQKIASFGVDADGELLLVGYEGTIFRLVLDDSDFGADPRRRLTSRLLRDNAPAAARVSIVGGDGKPYGPAGAAIRKTKRDESYFYADGSFDVELPPGRARLNVSGGIETIPQTVTVDAGDDHRADGADAAMDRHGGARLVFGRFARPPSHGRPDRGDGRGRAGRGPGGGRQLRQSLRVEQCRRRHPRRGADHRQTARRLDGSAPPGLRRGDEEHDLWPHAVLRNQQIGRAAIHRLRRNAEPARLSRELCDGRGRGPSGGRRDLRPPHVRRPAVSVR